MAILTVTTKKVTALVAIFLFLTSTGTVDAWAWKKTTEFNHTYDMGCSLTLCTVDVYLEGLGDSLLPETIFWQHKVNNPTGPYSQLVKSDTQYSFTFARQPKQFFYRLNVRSVMRRGVTESKNEFAINEIIIPDPGHENLRLRK